MISPVFMIFGVALPVLLMAGYVVTALILPKPLSQLTWAFAPGVGAGLCSLIFFIFRRPLFTVEFALLAFLFWLLHRREQVSDLLPGKWRPALVDVVLCTALGLVFGIFVLRVERMPHGSGDGWAIWNTHARVLYRNGPNWKAEIPYTFHGDYPLLVPSLTARFWRYAGQEMPEAGAITGVVLALSSISVLVAVLSKLREPAMAALFGLILAGTPFYLDHATSQYADVPLSFFILATIALICVHAERESDGPGALVLAGFTAGCAGWTKNEGLLFLAAVAIALLLPVALRRKKFSQRVLPFLAGLALPLMIIIVFKLIVPAHNDLIENQTYGGAIERITSLDRYVLTLEYFVKTLWTFGAWSLTPFIALFAYVLLKGIDRDAFGNAGWLAGCLILAIVLAGYFAVYINSPIELRSHLVTSLDRLMIQLWPSFLLLLGLCTQRPSLSGDDQAAVGTTHYSFGSFFAA